MAAELEVREHAQLFERRDGEILPFVDDQQRALAGARLFAQILLHRAQQLGLALALPLDAELFGDEAEKIVALDLRRYQLDRGQARSEERRVGKECVRTGRSRRSP